MSVPPNIASAEASTYTRVENFYLRKVKELFIFLTERRMNFFAGAVATFLIEPQNALYAAYYMQRGLDAKKVINLNPTRLSPEQLKYNPVLLVHGDQSNSGIFAPMIDQIVKDSPYRPIFTIDLTSADGIVSTKNHLYILVAKVNEILSLYPLKEVPEISFIGHSSGGDVLPFLIAKMEACIRFQAGIIFKIGSIFKQTEAREFDHYSQGKVIEIVGTRDVFEGCESHLPNKLVVDSGHLGLLFDTAVLNCVSKELTALSKTS